MFILAGRGVRGVHPFCRPKCACDRAFRHADEQRGARDVADLVGGERLAPNQFVERGGIAVPHEPTQFEVLSFREVYFRRGGERGGAENHCEEQTGPVRKHVQRHEDQLTLANIHNRPRVAISR